MNIGVLLDKEYLKGIIEKVTQMAFAKLKSMFPEVQTESENIVSALLVGQLALQATVRMLPRPRAVLDDAILTDVLALIRKMVGEKIEFERQNDGAAKVADSIRRCDYVTQAGIWEFQFVLQRAGAASEDAALDLVPDLVRWTNGIAADLAANVLSLPTNGLNQSKNQELDLKPRDSNQDPGISEVLPIPRKKK